MTLTRMAFWNTSRETLTNCFLTRLCKDRLTTFCLSSAECSKKTMTKIWDSRLRHWRMRHHKTSEWMTTCYWMSRLPWWTWFRSKMKRWKRWQTVLSRRACCCTFASRWSSQWIRRIQARLLIHPWIPPFTLREWSLPLINLITLYPMSSTILIPF